MPIEPTTAWIPSVTEPTARQPASLNSDSAHTKTEVRKAFDDFVGQTFYGQLISSMRKTVSKPAYFHGGRGEEVFQAQMDQMLAEKMADASADQFTGPMFDLFTLPRT